MAVIGWAMRASEQVDRNWRFRSKFVLAALSHRSAAERFERAPPDTPLGALLSEWPDTVGYLLSPYQCASWNPDRRLSRIEGHLRVLEELPGLKLASDDKLVLLDLGAISPDVSLIIDRPKWLSREGHLTLSIFKGEFRAFTVSFSLFDASELEIFIGGIQGRQGEDMLSLYRDLTKDFHGMRPRDFLVEALRILAAKMGAKHLYAVADDHKISRHAYFSKTGDSGPSYDEIWQERGGIRTAATHFELPLAGVRRNLEEIAAKKRSMYRRRYEMLDQIAASLPSDLSAAERRHFEAR